MTFLPVVERELRINARRSSTYWMRSGLGAGVWLIWFLVFAMSPAGTPIHVKALVLFWTVAVLAFAFCLLSGMFLTADCVSGERRDGTLGLLFLTDLRAYDVVFGKLAATSLNAVYGLLCVLPSLALSFLLGAVTVGEFWRVTVVLMVTMFLSLVIGLAISTASRDARQAIAGTLLALVGLAGLPGLLWWLAHVFTPGQTAAADFLMLISPPYEVALAADKIYATPSVPGLFWSALATQAGLGMLALVLAGSRMPRVWAEAPETADLSGNRWRSWLRFGNRGMRCRRRKLMERDPFCWLSVRDRLPTTMAWAVVVLLFAVWAAFLGGSFVKGGSNSGACFMVAVFMGYGAYVLWKSFVAIEAARRISEDRQTGALELLLVTTLDVEQMLEGQRRGLRRMFLGPGLVVLFMNTVLLGMVADIKGMTPGGAFSEKSCLVFIVGVLFVVLDLSALSDTGTWIGLKARRLPQTFTGMLGRVMLVPWLGVAVFAVAMMTGVGGSPGDWFMLLVVWMVFSLIADKIVGARARKNLERHFRPAAAGDFKSLSEKATGIQGLNWMPQTE